MGGAAQCNVLWGGALCLAQLRPGLRHTAQHSALRKAGGRQAVGQLEWGQAVLSVSGAPPWPAPADM